MLKQIIFQIVIVGCLINMAACTSYVVWKEEVKLNDGRIIVVEQKKLAGRGIAREAWLTIDLPEFSTQPIIWHENLIPLIVNVDSGKLYVVGYPPTIVECKKYGNPRPFYVGFVWNSGVWSQLPFKSIPKQIYTTNMLIEGFPPKETQFLTLEKKDSSELNGDVRYGIEFKYLDSNATCE